MNNELKIDPWISSPKSLPEMAWEYCRIRHFPACGEAFRISYVRIAPDDEAKVVTHEQSSELVCVLSGKALALVRPAGSPTPLAASTDRDCRAAPAGETERLLHPHDVVFLPKNTAHAFAAVDGEAVLLVVHTPAISPDTDHKKSDVLLARPKE